MRSNFGPNVKKSIILGQKGRVRTPPPPRIRPCSVVEINIVAPTRRDSYHSPWRQVRGALWWKGSQCPLEELVLPPSNPAGGEHGNHALCMTTTAVWTNPDGSMCHSLYIVNGPRGTINIWKRNYRSRVGVPH